jgi:hypothetical protein
MERSDRLLRLLFDGRRGGGMKDKRPQFIPGYLAACARTPILTAGELPGGGDLFRTCTRAVVEIQTSLALIEPPAPVHGVAGEPFGLSRLDGPTPCDCAGGCSRAHARSCERCGAAVSAVTDKGKG